MATVTILHSFLFLRVHRRVDSTKPLLFLFPNEINYKHLLKYHLKHREKYWSLPTSLFLLKI